MKRFCKCGVDLTTPGALGLGENLVHYANVNPTNGKVVRGQIDFADNLELWCRKCNRSVDAELDDSELDDRSDD